MRIDPSGSLNNPRTLFAGSLGMLCLLAAVLTATALLLSGLLPEANAKSALQSSAEGTQDSSETAPSVSVGEITGTPGASLMVPLYYTADPNVPLRSLTIEIDYVSNNLEFNKASRGVVTEKVGADVTATLIEGTPDENGLTRSKLQIATSLAEQNPQEGIPSGLLAFLLFRINPKAKPFAIRLNTNVILAEDLQSQPQEVTQIAATPGLVVVELADVLPEATCFFFTH